MLVFVKIHICICNFLNCICNYSYLYFRGRDPQHEQMLTGHWWQQLLFLPPLHCLAYRTATATTTAQLHWFEILMYIFLCPRGTLQVLSMPFSSWFHWQLFFLLQDIFLITHYSLNYNFPREFLHMANKFSTIMRYANTLHTLQSFY